jgi:hypothetical protein
MGSSLVKIDLGKLSKPATVLVNRIFDVLGGIGKPWQMKRVARAGIKVARANAKIARIKAHSRIEVKKIDRRGIERLIREEGKKQENIESITGKALPLLTDDAKPEEVEADWITHFFDRSRLVSDQEMQTLWAQLLASEANKPGTISKRTINLVATPDKRDAQLFSEFCSFVWRMGVSQTPVIWRSHPGPTEADFGFTNLVHLDSLGLIRFDQNGLFAQGYDPKAIPQEVLAQGVPMPCQYFGNSIIVRLPPGQSKIDTGSTILTQSGLELARISGAAESESALLSTLERWMELGCIVYSPLGLVLAPSHLAPPHQPPPSALPPAAD